VLLSFFKCRVFAEVGVGVGMVVGVGVGGESACSDVMQLKVRDD
jgi:hypothetical protein